MNLSKLFQVILPALLISGCTSTPIAWGSSTLKVNPERLVEVIGTVSPAIINEASQLHELSKSEGPIYVLLNSPGGDVSSGLLFIDAMNAARVGGTKIICVVGVMAASMAFNMLAHCDERYALPSSLLLFHPMRINSPSGLTTEETKLYSIQMYLTESLIKRQLIHMMGVERGWFERYYRLEFFWEASSLVRQVPKKFIRIVRRIEGVDNLYKVRRGFNLFGNTNPLVRDVRITN